MDGSDFTDSDSDSYSNDIDSMDDYLQHNVNNNGNSNA